MDFKFNALSTNTKKIRKENSTSFSFDTNQNDRPFHLRKRYCTSAKYPQYFREFRAIFTEKVHGQGKYLQKKNISKGVELKKLCTQKMSDIPGENLLKRKKVGTDNGAFIPLSA